MPETTKKRYTAEELRGMDWRELNCIVHRAVVGAWEHPRGEVLYYDYASNWSGVGRVVEAMEREGYMLQLVQMTDGFSADFVDLSESRVEDGFVSAQAPTAPRAVCEAAVLAMQEVHDE